MTPPPILASLDGDTHFGSTLAICPPEGVRLDDGGRYLPSKVQRWQWECWEDHWRRVGEEVRAAKARLWVFLNGDVVDGDHHDTPQILSRNPEAQSYVVERAMSLPLALKPDRLYVIRGTEAHVGSSGCAEEAFARLLKANKDEEAGTWSWWHLRIRVHGVLFDFKHHGRIGTRPWTRLGALGNLAVEIMAECTEAGDDIPDIAVRSHRHVRGDTGDNHRVRVIALPAWQLKTAFAHKVAAESRTKMGGATILVRPKGGVVVTNHLYQPAAPAVQ